MAGIQDFQRIAGQALQQGRLDDVLGKEGQSGITLNRPLNPPGNWTKFKAWLGGLPLLKNLAALRSARAEVDAYPQRLEEYKVSNRQIMKGFMQGLQAEFGPHVANMAMRDIDRTGGAPLTSRTVSKAIEGAKQQRESLKLRNNFNIGNFLESTATGKVQILASKQDMFGLLIERNVKLGEKPVWQDAFSKPMAKGMEKLFRLKCQDLPEYDKGELSNDRLAQVGNEVIDFLLEIRDTKWVSPEKLDEIVAEQTEGAASAKQFMTGVRNRVILAAAEKHLDRKDPQSLFSKTLDQVAQETGFKGSLPDAVLKSIANDLNNELAYSGDLPKLLGCKPDLSETETKTALETWVKEKSENAVTEHFKALEQIDTLQGMTGAQKKALGEIGRTRRLDTVQVQQFENACKWGQTLKGLTGALRKGDTSTALDSLKTLNDQFSQFMKACVVKARELSCGITFGTGESKQLMDELVKVALAGESKEALQEIFKELGGKDGVALSQTLKWVPLGEEGKDLKGCGEILGGLVRSLGKILEVPDKDVLDITHPNKDTPMGKLPPSMLLEVLGGLSDKRGVDLESPLAQKLVRKDLSLDGFRNKMRDEVLDYVNKDGIDKDTGLSSTFLKDLERTTFRLEGEYLAKFPEPLKGGREGVLKTFLEAFKGKEGEIDRKLAKAVSLCMNQNGINQTLERFMFQSVGGLGVGAIDESTKQAMQMSTTVHSARRDQDGNWLVTSENSYGLKGIVNNEGFTTLSPEQSVMVTSVTYKISKESIEQGNPAIELVDSKHFTTMAPGR